KAKFDKLPALRLLRLTDETPKGRKLKWYQLQLTQRIVDPVVPSLQGQHLTKAKV
ncbi:hypothetical protein WA026_017000, partial [Henosepilachna vigintioctopunctata]